MTSNLSYSARQGHNLKNGCGLVFLCVDGMRKIGFEKIHNSFVDISAKCARMFYVEQFDKKQFIDMGKGTIP